MRRSEEVEELFAAAIDRLTDKSDRIGLAISGGPDSLALLIMAARLIPARIVAATVDHRLRSEAAQEAHYVAEICARLNVPHCILQPSEPITGNIQSSARTVRYALLHKWADDENCKWIATAHHTDDQIETFLMRLARGSGVDGLASIREKNGNIIRPLLTVSKPDLEDVCALADIKPVRDPSNDMLEYDRVNMRQWLADNDLPFEKNAILQSTTALSEAYDALTYAAAQLYGQRVSEADGGLQLDHDGLPREYKRRLFIMVVRQFEDEKEPRGGRVSNAISLLESGENAMVGNLLVRPGRLWHFSKAPPRSNA